MRLEISEYESALALRAAAKFINELADIQEVRPERDDNPFADAPTPVAQAAPLEVPAPPLGTTRDDNLPIAPGPAAMGLAVETAAGPLGAPGPAGELDDTGLPWDERIHSSGKTKTNKGVWKMRRGLGQALVEQVKAELLGSVAPAAPVVETAPVAPDPAAVFGAQPAPVVPAAPAAPAVTALDWPAVMARVSPKMMDGTHDLVAEAQFLAGHQITSVHLLVDRPDLWENYLLAVGA